MYLTLYLYVFIRLLRSLTPDPQMPHLSLNNRELDGMITIWLLLFYIQSFTPAVGAVFGLVLSLVLESRG